MTRRSLLQSSDLDRAQALSILETALKDADDGELFLEDRHSETLVFDDGVLKNGSRDSARGFGLRAVKGEATGLAHATEISAAALKRAADAVKAVTSGHSGVAAEPPAGTNRRLYGEEDPFAGQSFAARVELLKTADAFARGLDPRVRQVTVSVAGEHQSVEIVRRGGLVVHDVRPLVRFNVSIVTEAGDKRGTGTYGFGGRDTLDTFLKGDRWQDAVREALRQSLVALDADAAPAGEMTVVMGPGWPGILLHEAIGHGLEGDFNRKGTSAFAKLMGERIAAKGVTVVDDGTIPGRRGSLTVDDEGTPSSRTVLIEDGILVGYMQDRLNARLMGVKPTGNGRRQSFAHAPMPRMTNTVMLNGEHDPGEILASVKNGLYAASFSGGQVDITSGKFVFQCTEAYLIENGKLGRPVKGAMLIGDGADALKRISMVGNDMALDPGIGTCGKRGQGVPVGVGQPTLRLDGITVGGTAT
ncbi:MAG: metalloprotease TldD [Hyphomicrobiales bacterium]